MAKRKGGKQNDTAIHAEIIEALRPMAVPLADLTPDPSNLQLHNDRQIAAIAGSLQRFGQQKPIVVDAKGVIVAGNGTFVAAQQLGWTHLAVVQTSLEGIERTLFSIADNRTPRLSPGWNEAALAAVLSDIKASDVDALLATGFTPGEVDALVASLDLSDAPPLGGGGPEESDGEPGTVCCPKCGLQFVPPA